MPSSYHSHAGLKFEISIRQSYIKMYRFWHKVYMRERDNTAPYRAEGKNKGLPTNQVYRSIVMARLNWIAQTNRAIRKELANNPLM